MDTLTPFFDELRAREFSRLDAAGHVYFDYTGSGLYAESRVRAHAELLDRSVLGNPHSRNPTSRASTRILEDCRERVLAFFDADPETYEVAFTPNGTGALKLVGESYPFVPGSRLLLTADNHNSVHGLREYASAKGATVTYAPLGADLRIEDLGRYLVRADPSRPHLFVYPAQSNFSGVKHPLEWIGKAREAGYDVLLDAAALVPSSPLSLRRCAPDFVSISFYKMFGYPTGVGALLARRTALEKLRRPWFGGGTVRFVAARDRLHLLHSTGRGFEDGTPNFLSIAAVAMGLDWLREIGMDRVQRRVAELTGHLLREIQALKHSNGAPLVKIYGPCTTEARGGTVALNVLDPEGRVVDCRTIEDRANEANISLRTGVFCNPGAAEYALEYADGEVAECFQTLPSGTFSLQQFSLCMGGKPVGAVRVSLGIASNEADIQCLLGLLTEFRDTPVTSAPVPAAG